MNDNPEYLNRRIKALEEALQKATCMAESWIIDHLEGTSHFEEAMDEINELKAVLQEK
jgi:hypothetical protein